MTSLCSDLLRQCIKNVTRSDEKLAYSKFTAS